MAEHFRTYRSKCKIYQVVNNDWITRRFSLLWDLQCKHWHKNKTCEADIKSTETKSCWMLFQKASVIRHSQKRWSSVSCVVWQKQQRFDSENLILKRKEFVAILHLNLRLNLLHLAPPLAWELMENPRKLLPNLCDSVNSYLIATILENSLILLSVFSCLDPVQLQCYMFVQIYLLSTHL